MKNKKTKEIFIGIFLLTLGYSLFLKISKINSIYSESNFQASLAEISTYMHSKCVPAVIVGSSYTTRLNASYFHDAGMDVANLGLAGCQTHTALEVVKEKKELPKLLLIETTKLWKKRSANDVAVISSMKSPIFLLGNYINVVRPDMRPSSIIYTQIKKTIEKSLASRRILHYKERKSPISKGIDPKFEEGNDPESEKLIEDMVKSGVDVNLVVIPHGDGWGKKRIGKIKEMSERLKIKLLEPGPEIAKFQDNLGFIDNTHLDDESSKLIVQKIVEIKKGWNKSGE